MFLLRVALLSLWQHRRRTLVLGTAIAFVTALMVVLLGVAEGMNRSLIESSTTLMSGHVNVAGFFKPTAGQSAPVVTHAKAVAEVVKNEVPEATSIAARGRGFAKVVSETGSMLLVLTGVRVQEEQGLKEILRIKEGRLEDLARPNSVLLFEEQAAELEVRVGDALTLSAPTARGTNNTADVTVVAVAKGLGLMSQFGCFVEERVLQKLYQLNEDTTGALQVYLPTADLDAVKRIQARLRDGLQRAGFELMEEDPRAFWFKFENANREAWTGQKLDVTNWQDEVSFAAWTVDLMNALAFGLGFVLLQVIGVGLMIVMWISIRERTREIGTLRAIGMQRTSLLVMFLAEGFLLGLFSTSAGIVSGLALGLGLDAAKLPLPVGMQFVLLSDTLKVAPTVQWAVATLVFITAVVTLISLVPASIAARLKPVTAMAHAV
jgi:ABC-type lipoprotein release transport system permease subunit